MVPSTCASDLVLAISCAVFAWRLARQAEPLRRYGAVGMVLMAIAAGIGAARYGGLPELRPMHLGASHLAGAVAPASFALVALALVRGEPARGHRLVLGGLAALGAGWLLFEFVVPLPLYRTLIGALGVVVMLGLALRLRTGPAVSLALGGLALALAGLVIGTEGSVGPVLAIDLFHLVLALAHGLVARGLRRIAAP